jgi:hypothetical protein
LPQGESPLVERTGMREQIPAVAQKLFALGGEHEAPADMIKDLKTQLLLQFL